MDIELSEIEQAILTERGSETHAAGLKVQALQAQLTEAQAKLHLSMGGSLGAVQTVLRLRGLDPRDYVFDYGENGEIAIRPAADDKAGQPESVH